MISLILILAIVGQAFAFPATDVTERKTEQQGSSLSQIPNDSPQEKKNEIQKPQFNIDHQEEVQPIKKEINSNYEAKTQSTVEEQPKLSQQPAPETSKVPESVLEYSNLQLLQLKPVTPDAVLVSSLQQPVLLPYIPANQIQPLSVIPVKQVDNINQSPPISAQEVANLVFIPALESTEQSNAQNQLHYASLIQSPDAPQLHLNINQPKTDQVGKSTAESQKSVESNKAQNVNNHQTFQQNEKQVPEGIQAVSTYQEKANTEPQDKAEQLTSNHDQSFLPIQYENEGSHIAQHHINKNIPHGEKIEQLNQGQAVTPTQYDNAPQYQNVQGSKIAQYQVETNSQLQDKFEQQLNVGQSAFTTQYENAPQEHEDSHIAQYNLNKNIPHGEKIEQQLNQGQADTPTQYDNAPQYQNVQGSKIAQYQVETNSQLQDKFEQQLNVGQSSFTTQYENAPQGSNIVQYNLNKNIPHGEKIEQQLNQGQADTPTQYDNAPQYQNVQGSKIAQYQVKTNSQPQDKFEQQLNVGQSSFAIQYENASQEYEGGNVAQYHLNKNIPHREKIEQKLNQGQADTPTQYDNAPQYQNVQGSKIAQYQVETSSQVQDQFKPQQLNQGQAVIFTQYLQTKNEQLPYQQEVQLHTQTHIEEQSNQQFNIKEEIQKAQAELQQNALAQHSQDHNYQ